MTSFKAVTNVMRLQAELAEAVRRIDYMQRALELIQSKSENTSALLYPMRVLNDIGWTAKDALDHLFGREIHKQKGERDAT